MASMLQFHEVSEQKSSIQYILKSFYNLTFSALTKCLGKFNIGDQFLKKQ